MKKLIFILLKASVSLLILIYLFTKIDLQKIWAILQQGKLSLIILAIAIYIGGEVLCAHRWKIMAEVMEFQNSFKEFLFYYFAGMFLNLFLPTMIGGDVGKCYFLARRSKKTIQAIVSVLADRGSGFAVLIFMCGFSLYVLRKYNLPTHLVWAILAANILLIIGLLLPLFARNYLPGDGIIGLSLSYWKKPWALLRSLFLSSIFQILVVVIHILIARSLGLHVSWKYFFLLIPLVALASMFPVSLSGLGVREWAYVYFLSIINVPAAEGLTFGIIWFFILLVSGLIGGLTFFTKEVAIFR